jgi:hypothetical protein
MSNKIDSTQINSEPTDDSKQPESSEQPEQTEQPYKIPDGDNNKNNSTPTFLSHIRTGFWD